MNFTFGIITGGNNDSHINLIIDSIEKQNIPNYEVIIVGASNINRNNTRIIPFNENIFPLWITKKKNTIISEAQFENIVFMHDYIILNDDWYAGFLKYGNDFDVCMTRILNSDCTRFRDWVLWPHNGEWTDSITENRECLIPYDMNHMSEYMYISGAYWVAKAELMNKYPLDETLLWGQGEDVLWSKQVRKEYVFSMNQHSSVQLLKYKDPVFLEASQETICKLKNTPIKIAINYFSHNRNNFWDYFKITSYFLDKIKPHNKKYIKLNILSSCDYDWEKLLPKGIQYEIVKFNDCSINYLEKVHFAINQPQEYSVKLDEDCFFSNYIWDYIIENINFLKDDDKMLITPLLSNNIPLVDKFIEDFIDDKNTQDNIYNSFKTQIFPNNLWGVDYSHLNHATIFAKEWSAQTFYSYLEKLYTVFKGIHPIRINANSQEILNDYILENFHKITKPYTFDFSEFSKIYFTTSTFIIKTRDWKKLLNEQAFDAYDEVQLNVYAQKNKLKFYYIKNGFGIHTIYNTIYENKNVWNIGMENGREYEFNFVCKIKELLEI